MSSRSAPNAKIFKAVVFDKDGTLFDTEALFRGIARTAAARLGYSITDEIHDGFIGGTVDNTKRVLFEAFGSDFPFDDFHGECRTRMNEHHSSSAIPMRPGAVAAVQHFVDIGVPLGLATSARGPEARRNLEAAGLLKCFDVIVTRDDVTNPKPNPEPYLRAAELLGFDASDCIAVEDSAMGATSAVNAGMTTFVVPDHSRPQPQLATLEAIVLQDLTEFIERVGALNFSLR